MIKPWPTRYSDEVLDYELDWTLALDDDTITGVTATASAGSGLEVENVSTTDGVTTLWLAGGAGNKRASVHLLATTAGGRKIGATVEIQIKAA